MAHSSKRAAARKPYATFPLTPRSDGRWCKKIKGTPHYFYGKPDEALAEYWRVADDLEGGRVPRRKAEGITVAEGADGFLRFKDAFPCRLCSRADERASNRVPREKSGSATIAGTFTLHLFRGGEFGDESAVLADYGLDMMNAM